MTLTATQYALWFAGFVAHASVAAVMFRRESYRRWPSLFSLAIFELSLTLILFALSKHYAAYFYVYWGGYILRAFLGLWLVFDVIKSIPSVQYAPRSLSLAFLSIAIALAVGSAWLASSGGTQTFHITMMAFALGRCISVIWGTFAITLFMAIGFCGMGWTPTPLRMASTFLFLVLISCADSYAMSIWPKLSFRIDEMFNLCIIGIWFSWSEIMRKEQSAPRGVIAFPPIPQVERGSGI